MKLWSLLPVLAILSAPAALGQQLGVIDFPNSGSAEAQEPFLRGVLLLHSFEYDDAAAAFQKAQSVAPKFALAYWGEAMTHYRPVWGRENLASGRAALKKAGAAAGATPRERGYLNAAGALFGDGSRDERWKRYSEAMGRLARSHPDDQEAAALHAVSLFGTTGGSRDARTYMRIAAIAQGVFRANPDHPGALHYLIHAFDDPVHAPLGLHYARLYSDVASDAPHAQHMPTHIFLALGMWDECISSNLDSWNSAEARVERLGLGSDKRGYHALWWMQYAYLQKGDLANAREKLSVIEKDAAKSGSKHARDHHAYLRSHFLVDGEQWKADLAPVDDDGLTPRAWGANALAEGLRAVMVGDLDGARKWSGKLRAKADAAKDDGSSLPIAALELEAVLLIEKGDGKEALRKLREAVRLEDATPFGYGPPFPVKPSLEVLGEALLALGRPGEALEAFESSLARTPGRALSLRGLKAARSAGADAAPASGGDTRVR